MSHSNISIFVPHVGCPHMCAFCNQRTITGTEKIPHGEDVLQICSKALTEIKNPEQTEIAFFGGSFTAIHKDYMVELLQSAQEFIGEGKFSGIRISTRPDYIDSEILKILKEYGVTSIELGAQSLEDSVLTANERGHTAKDVKNACRLIKAFGFELGLQMMIGLYKSSEQAELSTAEKIISLAPDTVRIYPVVILENTRLGELFKSGEFKPMDFDMVVDITSRCMQMFENAGIKVIKVGLHSSEFVEQNMLGGFYHPAFRELCEGRIYRERISEFIAGCGKISGLRLKVPKGEVSKVIGQKKCNKEYFAQMGIKLEILPEDCEDIQVIDFIK